MDVVKLWKLQTRAPYLETITHVNSVPDFLVKAELSFLLFRNCCQYLLPSVALFQPTCSRQEPVHAGCTIRVWRSGIATTMPTAVLISLCFD